VEFEYLRQGQRFVWDKVKAAANLDKHGIGFEEACEVFLDPFLRLEDASIPNETRDAAIGLTEDWKLVLVVHLRRENDTIRVISARAATAQERRAYEDSE
jgi:uncharacterized DUF497 family protein